MKAFSIMFLVLIAATAAARSSRDLLQMETLASDVPVSPPAGTSVREATPTNMLTSGTGATTPGVPDVGNVVPTTESSDTSRHNTQDSQFSARVAQSEPISDDTVNLPLLITQAPTPAAPSGNVAAQATPTTFPFARVQATSTGGCAAACKSYYGSSTGVVINGGTSGRALCYAEVRTTSNKYYEYAGIERTYNGALACLYWDGTTLYYRRYTTGGGYSCGCTTTSCGSYPTSCNSYFWGYTSCACTSGCVCRGQVNGVWYMGWRTYDGYYTSNKRCYTPDYTFTSGISMFLLCLPTAPVPV